MILVVSLAILALASLFGEAAFVSEKNKNSIVFQKLTAMASALLSFALFGYGLEEQGSFFAGVQSIFSLPQAAGAFPFLAGAVSSTLIALFATSTLSERSQTSVYIILGVVIGALLYPIFAVWTHAGGFLNQMGFIDNGVVTFHIMLAVIGLIGSWMVGARLGKYENKKVNAMPSGQLYLGGVALVFAWLGWPLVNQLIFFKKGIADFTISYVIFVIIVPLASFVFGSVISRLWLKYIDISFVYNVTLVGIITSASLGYYVPLAIGLITSFIFAGLTFWLGTWIDETLQIDDPAGIITIHFLSSLEILLLYVLFGTALANENANWWLGLLVSAVSYVIVGLGTGLVIFLALKLADNYLSSGLRLSIEEESVGKDSSIFHLPVNYNGLPAVNYSKVPVKEQVAEDKRKVIQWQPTENQPEPTVIAELGNIRKFEIITNPNRLERLTAELMAIGVEGMNVGNVTGFGIQRGHSAYYRGVEVDNNFLPKIKLEVVVSTISTENMLAAIQRALYTGHIGDGKVFISSVQDVVRVSTGEKGVQALKYRNS